MSPEHGKRGQRAARELRGALLVALTLGAGSVACDAALIGGGVAALAGGSGFLAAQCYDQVSVRVRDDEGRRTCDAHVSIASDGSERRLRPCYHASLTEGRYHVSVQRDGYVPADMQFDVPEHKGACPHYTHTIEFTLRRPGAPAEPSNFGHPRAPVEAVSSHPRERGIVPAPIPVPAPAALPPPAAAPAPAAASPAAPTSPPAEPAPPSAAFPPAPAAPPPPAATPPAPAPPPPAPPPSSP
jgi:hypothetical protein